MPSMKKLKDRIEILMGRRSKLDEIVDVSRRIIPADLQEQILEACQQERAAVLARIAEIDEGLARIAELDRAAKEARQATLKPIVERPRPVRRLDGTIQERPARIRVHVATPATIEANKARARICAHKRALQVERAHRHSELGEILRIEDQTRAGVVTGLLFVVTRWRNRVDVGKLLPAAKLGRSYSDAAGNPLPPEALDAQGEPTLSLGGQRVEYT